MANKKRPEYRLSEKTWENYYDAYIDAYYRKQERIEMRGQHMFEGILSFEDYKMTRQALINEGYSQNVNRTIIQQQASYMGYSEAKNLLSVGEEYDLDFAYKTNKKGERVLKTAREMMMTRPEDLGLWDLQEELGDEESMSEILTSINDMLKRAHPTWNGKQRAGWISHEVYGS